MECNRGRNANAKLRDFWYTTVFIYCYFIDCDYDTCSQIFSGSMGILFQFIIYFYLFYFIHVSYDRGLVFRHFGFEEDEIEYI